MTALYENSYPAIEAKTADYQVEPEDHGTLFTNRGASGTVAFTLPSTADLNPGWRTRYFAAADNSLRVASTEGDNMITFNDAAADDVELQTSSEILGGGMEIVYDGTSFLVFLMTEETQTVTVAT